MNIIFLGAPGAGKGTQSEVVAAKLSIPTISSGDLIRAALKSGSEIGVLAKSYVEKGQLVPDEVVINIIKERLKNPDCTDGFILDGFPRTAVQAQALSKMGVNIDKVIEIDVPDDVIEKRLCGRRVCSGCGATYHTEWKKPSAEGSCDKCGGGLITRKDDDPATVKDRLIVYHEQTKPLTDYYRNHGKLAKVNGNSEFEAITAQILSALES